MPLKLRVIFDPYPDKHFADEKPKEPWRLWTAECDLTPADLAAEHPELRVLVVDPDDEVRRSIAGEPPLWGIWRCPLRDWPPRDASTIKKGIK